MSEHTTLPANDDRKSAIVTVRSCKHAKRVDVPDLTPEEHKQRGDAADALFRDMKRAIAEKVQTSEDGEEVP